MFLLRSTSLLASRLPAYSFNPYQSNPWFTRALTASSSGDESQMVNDADALTRGIVFKASKHSTQSHSFGTNWRSGCSFPEITFAVAPISNSRNNTILDGMTRFQKIKIIFSGFSSSESNYFCTYNSIYHKNIRSVIFPCGEDISINEEIIPVGRNGTTLKFTHNSEMSSFDVYHIDTELNLLANYLYIDPNSIERYADFLIAHSKYLRAIFSQIDSDTDPQKILNAIKSDIILLNSIVSTDAIDAGLKRMASSNLIVLKRCVVLMDNLQESPTIGRISRILKAQLAQTIAELNQEMLDLSSFLAAEMKRLEGEIPVEDKSLLEKMEKISNKITSGDN